MIQEWFYLHPWSYWMYWLGWLILLFIIYLLPTVKVESKKLIIRLPHALSGSVEAMQGINERMVQNDKI